VQAELRTLAANDIDTAVAYCRNEVSPETAFGFIDDVEAAITHLCRHPLTGSLRFAHEVEVPELRSWPLKKFPYLVFDVPDADRIDIWRVLHANRDIPAHLAAEQAG